MVLRAMAETGAEPGQTVMIGDTSFDIEMGLAAKAKTIGVTWGNHPVVDLTTAPARTDWLIDLSDLLAHAIGTLTSIAI